MSEDRDYIVTALARHQKRMNAWTQRVLEIRDAYGWPEPSRKRRIKWAIQRRADNVRQRLADWIEPK